MNALLKVLICTIFVVGVQSDSCISALPNLAKGSNCGGLLPCALGLYCDMTGVCNPQIAAGSACNSSFTGMCALGTTCLGLPGSQTCVANASPGETCSTNTSLTTPICGPGLFSCYNVASQTGTCGGGVVGDSCYNSSDCAQANFLGQHLNCTASICTPIPIGGYCSSTSFCATGSYCSGSTCQSYLVPGSICTTGICSPGYYCIGTSPTDSSPICVQNQTLTPGQYCGNYNDLCMGSRFCQSTGAGGYCSKLAPDTCIGGSSCNAQQVCVCDGGYYQAGYGNCIPNPCYQLGLNYQNCMIANCGSVSSVYASLVYSKSCGSVNCLPQANAYLTCSEGRQLIPGLFFLISFFAIFFSKNF